MDVEKTSSRRLNWVATLWFDTKQTCFLACSRNHKLDYTQFMSKRYFLGLK